MATRGKRPVPDWGFPGAHADLQDSGQKPMANDGYPSFFIICKDVEDSRVRSTLRVTLTQNRYCLEVLQGVWIHFYRETKE